MTAYNLGVRRETSVEVVARWRAEARPRIVAGADTRVVFSFGANDATEEEGSLRVAPEDSVRALRAALDGAAELGLPAFVVGPPPTGDDAHAERIEALSARLAGACSAPVRGGGGAAAALRSVARRGAGRRRRAPGRGRLRAARRARAGAVPALGARVRGPGTQFAANARCP